MSDLSEKRSKAGALGGRSTYSRHGREHMQAIGKKGALSLWQRYNLLPWNLSGWALVDKTTGELKRTW
jgi:hypothetical protein